MKKISIIFYTGIILLLGSCDDTTTNNNAADSSNSPIQTEKPASQGIENSNVNESNSQGSKKTDGEIILEATDLAVNAISDLIEIKRIKDSIRQANKNKMFAYQIGLKMGEREAYSAYKTLKDENISSIYVFKVGRKEYYIVQFEANGEEELKEMFGAFKTQLGENGTEGLKVINLNDFCNNRETITKLVKSEDGIEIKCLTCK